MEKKRKIIINDPRLRRIRNSLRNAIVQATFQKLNELVNRRSKYIAGDSKRKHLIQESQNLKNSLKASVCICPICRSHIKDMILHPTDKMWFCIECYEEQHEWYNSHPNSTERPDAPNPFP